MASATREREGMGEIRVSSTSENPRFSGERCPASASASSSSSSSSSSSAAASSSSGDCNHWRQCGSDCMVKRELDAAYALADLSQMAPIEVGQYEQWGNRGRRSRKRSASGSPLVLDRRKDVFARPGSEAGSSKIMQPLDPIQNCPLEVSQQHKNFSHHIDRRAVTGRVDSAFAKLGCNHSRAGTSFCRGNPRQNLSESEKEAKRLRRILANRESARQTILRRQAFCDELTRKAAELTLDNHSIKQEKELVMKEFQSLKDQNKHLKVQVAKMIKGEDEGIKSDAEVKIELEETPTEDISAFPERSLCMQQQQQHPTLPGNRIPFMPFAWPPFYPIQTNPFLQNTNESKDPSSASMAHLLWTPGQDTFCGPRMPFYMLPCPWFCPPPNHWSVPFSDPHTSAENDGDSIDGRCNQVLLSKSAVNTENACVLAGRKQDVCSSAEASSKRENDPNSVADQDHTLGCYTKGMGSTSNSGNTFPQTSTVKCENVLQADLDSEGAVSSGNLQGTSVHHSSNLVDASTAAAARKKRKELTKLKSHSRQFQLPS